MRIEKLILKNLYGEIMSKIIEINTKNIGMIDNSTSITDTRKKVASYDLLGFNSDVTIIVQSYNGLEKTKNCIGSILEFTKDINYDLLLIDNGSTDGTFEFFKSVPYEKKNIIHLNSNKGSPMPWMLISPSMLSPYIALLNNDIVVTYNWLNNLLKVAKSNDRIGMVNPVSSNVSNNQCVNINFSDYKEMHKIAAKHNVSDIQKWHERLRLITLGTLFSKECLCAIGVPLFDVGFSHNFGDDDISFRVRRAGYKAILAGDTWVHHDDDKKQLPRGKAVKIQKDLNIGRENFREKYFGIDAWDDVINFIPHYLQVLKQPTASYKPSILGIDTRCGTPILEIKNHLRSYKIFDADCYAYTTDGKYVIDLQTFCGANHVYAGEINRLHDHFDVETLDYIVIGNDINTYNDPFNIIKSAFGLLKKGGQIFISLQNVNNIFEFLYSIGHVKVQNPVHALNYTVEEFLGKLQQKGYNARFISASYFSNTVVSELLAKSVYDVLKMLSVKELEETIFRLRAERFYYVIEK